MGTSACGDVVLGDVFLANLFRRTNAIYGNAVRVQETSEHNHSPLVVPGLLNFIGTIADRIIGDFGHEQREIFGSLIHDLRNVLTAIIINADRAKIHWCDRKYSEAQKGIGKLHDASCLSRDMVVDAGKRLSAHEQCDQFGSHLTNIGEKKINEIIQIALNLSETRRVGKHHVNCLTPIMIRSHGSDLVRVLLNLFNNAYDAMNEKIYEKGENPFLKVYTDVVQNGLEIEVRDNGIGMVPEVLHDVFVPSFTTKVDKGNSGLGLPLCKRIIEERMQGTIHMESTFGKGTIVRINVPIA